MLYYMHVRVHINQIFGIPDTGLPLHITESPTYFPHRYLLICLDTTQQCHLESMLTSKPKELLQPTGYKVNVRVIRCRRKFSNPVLDTETSVLYIVFLLFRLQ